MSAHGDENWCELVYSVEHPNMSAPRKPAFQRRDEQHYYLPLNGYVIEGVRLTPELASEGVRNYHHILKTYVQRLCEDDYVMGRLRGTWDHGGDWDTDEGGQRKSRRVWQERRLKEEEAGKRLFFLMAKVDKL